MTTPPNTRTRKRKKTDEAAATKPQPAYKLPEPIDDLFDWGGRLRDLRTLIVNKANQLVPGPPVCMAEYGRLGAQPHWFDADRFEELAEQCEMLRAELKTAKSRKYCADACKHVEAALVPIFQKYMTEVAQSFYQHQTEIAQYFLAKFAHAQLPKPKLDEPESNS